MVKDGVDTLWLYYYVSSVKRELKRRASGSTFLEISRDNVRSLPILLPPLAEQRAIAAVLDSIDEAIERTEEVIAATETLRDSLLHELLTRGVPGWHTEWKEVPGIGTIPADWQVVRLGDVCEAPQYGASAAAQPYDPDLPRYVRITDLTDDGRLSPDEPHSADPDQVVGYELRDGDLLFARSGSVGRSYLYRDKDGPCVYAGYLIRFKADTTRVLPSFLEGWTHSQAYFRWIATVARRGAQTNINAAEYASMPLPLPSVMEQQAIVGTLERVIDGITAVQIGTGVLKSMKVAMSNVLLTGKARAMGRGGTLSQELNIDMITDENGLVGRECPDEACGRYFKIKPGTGVNTPSIMCPYCRHESDPGSFLTVDQKEYVRSVVAKKIVEPTVKRFASNIQALNRNQPRGMIRLEASVRHEPIPMRESMERELETFVICDQCHLEFAIYGVFAICPCCGRTNALWVLMSSLETCRKKLSLANRPDFDEDLRRDFPKDALIGAVAAFDAFGKALMEEPNWTVWRERPNLFQDIESLDKQLQSMGKPGCQQLIGEEDWIRLKWLFQARHVYDHRHGVVDERFIQRIPYQAHLLGRVLPLDIGELDEKIRALEVLAQEIVVQLSGVEP